METLIYAFNAVTPLLILISLGYILRRVLRLSDNFFPQLNSFCYRILLPIQLFYNVYKIEKFSTVNWGAIIYAIAWIPIAIVLGILMSKLFIKDHRQKGAFVQATFRSNQAIMGLPLAKELGGDAAMPVASLATSLGIPIFNVSAVAILKIYNNASGKKTSLAEIVKGIITNPLIIGVFSGMICVAIRYLIPEMDGSPMFTIENNLPPVFSVIKTLSGVASPVMLICLGASLKFSFTKSLLFRIFAGVLMRLVIIPGAAIAIAVLHRNQLGLTPAEYPMLVAFLGSPVAVSSAILVKETGGDEVYAGQLVIWSSVFSMISLFTIIAILKNFGYL